MCVFVIVRINLHSAEPLWNWGLLMYEEDGSYCRTLSPELMDSFVGMEVSYYVSARNLLNDLRESPIDYFTYIEFVEEPEDPVEEEEEETESTGHTSNFKQYCEPSWVCGEWSDCNNGIMQRNCVDRNHCSYSYNKPNEVGGCETGGKVSVDDDYIYALLIGGIFTIILMGILVVVLARR